MVKTIQEIVQGSCPVCSCARSRYVIRQTSPTLDRMRWREPDSAANAHKVAIRNLRGETDSSELDEGGIALYLWVRCEGCNDDSRFSQVG